MSDPRTWPCPVCNGTGKVVVEVSELTHGQYLAFDGRVQRLLWRRGEALVPCESCKGTGKYRPRKRAVVEPKNSSQRG